MTDARTLLRTILDDGYLQPPDEAMAQRIRACLAAPAPDATDATEAVRLAREALALREKATPGPWRQSDYAPGAVMVYPNGKPRHVTASGPASIGTPHDAAFIAHAGTHGATIARALLDAEAAKARDSRRLGELEGACRRALICMQPMRPEPIEDIGDVARDFMARLREAEAAKARADADERERVLAAVEGCTTPEHMAHIRARLAKGGE